MIFHTESHYVAQAGFRQEILFAQPIGVLGSETCTTVLGILRYKVEDGFYNCISGNTFMVYACATACVYKPEAGM